MSDEETVLNYRDWVEREEQGIDNQHQNLRWEYLRYRDLEEEKYNIINELDDEYFLEYIKRIEKNENLIKAMQDYFILHATYKSKCLDNWYSVDKETWEELFSMKGTLEFKIHRIIQNLKLLSATRCMQEPEQAPETSIPKIIWYGKTVDLARIYKELFKAGLITITGREFSKHFIDKKSTDIPLDFIENLSTKQDCFSPKQHVESLQLKIREMKPESGE